MAGRFCGNSFIGTTDHYFKSLKYVEDFLNQEIGVSNSINESGDLD